jgi:flavin reductase (DIM6/NTAB) family NADH-FMN oxidoreductase RutF
VQAKADPKSEYRKALAQYATGVTIVTTTASDGTPVGLTVNSFASVSLDPPLVLWSLSHQASSLAAFRTCENYLVHVLAADQLDLASRFADRLATRFDGIVWRFTDGGLPYLLDCSVAWFECGNRAQHEAGDHVILVGRVEAFSLSGGAPLIFHNSRYVTELSEAPLPRALLRPR